jgi:hypothetical protein
VEQSSPLNGSAVSAASALNRLAASNGEITITTTHGPTSASIKASPNSVHSVKDDEDDLLNDSSSEYFDGWALGEGSKGEASLRIRVGR